MSTEEEERQIAVGETFGFLEVYEIVNRTNGKSYKIKARCVCGDIREYYRWQISRNLIKSCGCKRGNPQQAEAFGETKSLKEWHRDDRCVVKYVTLVQRVARGWTTEAAITTPVVPRWDTNRYRKSGKPT